MILVIDRKEMTLRYQTGCICIEQPGEKSRRVALNQLEQVIVYGNPLAESAVWRALSVRQIPTVFLSLRGPEQAAMLGSGLAIQLPLRRLQHRCANHDGQNLAMAKYFVALKLQSYAVALTASVFEDKAVSDFEKALDITQQSLTQAETLEQVLGLEGQAARAWFQIWQTHLPENWRFTGRNRRPPKDPVNALLSLAYTLLLSEVRQAVIASGMDPSLGFLHQDLAGRESLALDFCEIFRSGVDRLVLEWFDRYGFNDQDFYFRSENGCRLSKAARPCFFKLWAQTLQRWPRPLGQLHDGQWPVAPLKEQITGQVQIARVAMQVLEEQHG